MMSRYEQEQLLNLDGVHKEFQTRLEKYRINPDDFSDNYDKIQIGKDKALVEKYKEEHRKQNNTREIESKKMADIFESILCEQAEMSEWLGSNVTTIACAEFDDFVNGVDMVAEFTEGDHGYSHLGLAVDATYSSVLSKKFNKIKSSIDDGKLASIKYFQSEDMDYMGQLSRVPRVVLGVKNETITNLIELSRANNKKALGEHWIQFQILEQALMQLNAFEKYAKKVNQDRLAEKISKVKNKLDKIYNERKKTTKDTGERDGFSEIIEKNLRDF